MKFQKPRFLSDKELNTIRGKALVGKASVEEIQQVFGHIDTFELKLEDCDNYDRLGTEGWRHSFDHPDAE